MSISKSSRISILLGAIFLMATSSIGPGFLTQTTVFTEQFAASFAFAILASIFIDIGVQLNVWRIIAVTKKRGQDIANAVLPGLGTVIAILIVMGGLAFNIGNVAGAGLGLNIIFGLDTVTGAAISAAFGIAIFAWREAGKVIDRVTQVMGLTMIVLTGWICFKTNPPVGEALIKSVNPDGFTALIFPMITIVGGTVGGYITFAGGHRLLDAGITGQENLKAVNRSATIGILVTGVMRVFVFLAVLGVVTAGVTLDPGNPTASVFRYAAGDIGYLFFGIVLWCASMTSVVGAAYTSVSFLQGLHPFFEVRRGLITMGFIFVSAIVFAFIGRPVTVLIIVGALNGMILPLTLGTVLLAAYNKKIVGDYKHPKSLFIFGVAALVITIGAGWFSMQGIANLWK